MKHEYIKGLLVNERRQCSFLIIECQGYLDMPSISPEEKEIYQTVIDKAYARSKELNEMIAIFNDEKAN